MAADELQSGLAGHLISLSACQDGIEWVGKRRSRQKAWDDCPRGDWLLWYAARVGVGRKLLVLASCACARTALVYVPVGEDRPRLAIETAEAWCRGEATIVEVRAAAVAARRAAEAASSSASSAYAPSAPYAASDASDASDAASSHASSHATVVVRRAAHASRREMLGRCADLVRGIIPTVP